jgi:hypothetical protein
MTFEEAQTLVQNSPSYESLAALQEAAKRHKADGNTNAAEQIGWMIEALTVQLTR